MRERLLQRRAPLPFATRLRSIRPWPEWSPYKIYRHFTWHIEANRIKTLIRYNEATMYEISVNDSYEIEPSTNHIRYRGKEVQQSLRDIANNIKVLQSIDVAQEKTRAATNPSKAISAALRSTSEGPYTLGDITQPSGHYYRGGATSNLYKD